MIKFFAQGLAAIVLLAKTFRHEVVTPLPPFVLSVGGRSTPKSKDNGGCPSTSPLRGYAQDEPGLLAFVGNRKAFAGMTARGEA